MATTKEYDAPFTNSNKQYTPLQTTAVPVKKSNYTWIWIIIGIIIFIIIIVIIYFVFFNKNTPTPTPLPTPNNSTVNALFKVNEFNPSTGAQTINPVGNNLYIFGPTATQTITIGSSSNIIGSILGIRNAATTSNNNLIVTAGSGITFIPSSPSGISLPPGGYTEFVLTRTNTYTRLI